MGELSGLASRLDALRRAFDQGFREPRSTSIPDIEDLLAIRLGLDAYALRLRDVAALGADRPLTPVPSDNPGLLGVAGLRGAIVAVYDLGALLGRPVETAPRWLALAKGSSATAFAFSQFEGQLRLPRQSLASESPRTHHAVGEVARCGDTARPVIDLGSLARTLELRAGKAGEGA
jgi:chemotaxis signal transduction protein